MANDWINDPNFNPDDFAYGLFVTNSGEDFRPTETGVGEDDEVDWFGESNVHELNQRQFGNGSVSDASVVPIIRRSNISADETDGGYINWPTSGSAATQRATDEARERERINRARNRNPRGMAEGSTTTDSGSDDKGRFDSRTTNAIEYAREQLQSQRKRDGRKKTDDREGIGEVSPDSRVVNKGRLSVAPEFAGCSFRGTFQKLQTLGNGEWVLQVKCLIQDGDEVKKLDKSQGLILRISIERVPITEQ